MGGFIGRFHFNSKILQNVTWIGRFRFNSHIKISLLDTFGGYPVVPVVSDILYFHIFPSYDDSISIDYHNFSGCKTPSGSQLFKGPEDLLCRLLEQDLEQRVPGNAWDLCWSVLVPGWGMLIITTMAHYIRVLLTVSQQRLWMHRYYRMTIDDFLYGSNWFESLQLLQVCWATEWRSWSLAPLQDAPCHWW